MIDISDIKPPTRHKASAECCRRRSPYTLLTWLSFFQASTAPQRFRQTSGFITTICAIRKCDCGALFAREHFQSLHRHMDYTAKLRKLDWILQPTNQSSRAPSIPMGRIPYAADPVLGHDCVPQNITSNDCLLRPINRRLIAARKPR